MPDRLAGDEAGVAAAVDRLELVEHPQHVLGVGHDVRRRDVRDGPDVPGHLPHPAAADLLLLARAQVVRDRRPRRPCAPPSGMSTTAHFQVIHMASARTVSIGLLRVEADAALATVRARRCAGRGSRGRPVTCPSSMRTGMANEYSRSGQRSSSRAARVEVELRGDAVELRLGHLERVVRLARHV